LVLARIRLEPLSLQARDLSPITLLNNSISLALASTYRVPMVSLLALMEIAGGAKAGSGRTDGNAPTVGVYGSNPNLASNGQKIDLTSKSFSFQN
jgi:hypothetical protein